MIGGERRCFRLELTMVRLILCADRRDVSFGIGWLRIVKIESRNQKLALTMDFILKIGLSLLDFDIVWFSLMLLT